MITSTSCWALNLSFDSFCACILINMDLVTHCIFVPDLSLFDELDNLGDADDLLVALEKGSYVSNSICHETCTQCTKLNVSDRS